MLDCTLVRTFTPHIPAGAGPTLVTAEDAVTEILKDIREQTTNQSNPSEDALATMTELIVNGLKMTAWIDGTYTIFEDYQLVVKTMQRWQFDRMPEFSGY